ncbi:hypothetical protein [Iningainema tapete]|uniref:Uncharacterized protein n=1 Tax=Iningainema tapete BLCC-T55 TaxID=2748662 RepID=A0A8J7BX88_9CYAN|nr:hypothetical protein [Iningainema tapete]MBD2773342.1 hypothetical protein [Iningainema tapete BLCC-T55]
MSQRIQLNLRLDKHSDLYERLKTRAREQGSSLNDFAINALRQALGLDTEYSPLVETMRRIEVLEQQMQKVLKRLEIAD